MYRETLCPAGLPGSTVMESPPGIISVGENAMPNHGPASVAGWSHDTLPRNTDVAGSSVQANDMPLLRGMEV